MDRKVYPSDISREQFEAIRGLFEQARHRTTPRRNDLYDVFCAILYLLKSGCNGRALTGDFRGWPTVRYYFDLWTKMGDSGSSLFEQTLKKFGQTRAYEEWACRKNQLLHFGPTKREERRYGPEERI